MTVTWTELEVQRQAFLAKDLNFVLKENKMKLKKKKKIHSLWKYNPGLAIRRARRF